MQKNLAEFSMARYRTKPFGAVDPIDELPLAARCIRRR
ncbi:hypothetical protein APY03_1998 [Variovorax sp. WDL1]|nr:hypothetical protein APY03_1998 [Variovorax sp. WDL1]